MNASELLHQGATAVLRHPVAITLALAGGGLLGFVYSYIPLHSEQIWHIEYLEGRLQQQKDRIHELEAELTGVRLASATLPDPTAIAALQERADGAEVKSEKLEKERDELARRVDKVTRSRDRWRAKAGDFEEKLSLAQSALEAAPTAAASDPEATPAPSPAAPAPDPAPPDALAPAGPDGAPAP